MSIRTAVVYLSLGLSLALASACNKPSDADCRKAIANMRHLLETDKIVSTADTEAAVRRCRGNSKKKTVQCAIDAKTVDELKACNLVPEPKPEPAPTK